MLRPLSAVLSEPGPLIMGILNATPDSFSDGGLHVDPSIARAAALEMCAEGVDIIDIGGESTRPGSRSVEPAVQLNRVLPIIETLIEAGIGSQGVSLSIDTASAQVAESCIQAGCQMVNDVTAGTGDPNMLRMVAEQGVHMVLMHMQGSPETMQLHPLYDDVVLDVLDFLERRVEAALTAGVEPSRILLDPGIGFGKTREHNLDLLRGLSRIAGLGFPLVLGCSRKRFMGGICRESDPLLLSGATVATTAYGVLNQARVFRVHEVRANRQAADLTWALMQA